MSVGTWSQGRVSRVAPALFLTALVTFSVVLFGRFALHVPFWYDESLTLRLSRLDLRDLWHALTAGFEFNPPLIYLLTRAGRALPGPETLTARIPGLAGYALLLVSMFAFMRRRLGAWFGLAATGVMPLMPYTIRYAVEARAYMLVLGVSGCALVCWQRAGDRGSWGARIGLAVCTAVALLLHVWALLLPMALLAGEIVHWIQTRRLRGRVLWPLAAVAPVIALYPPLLRASRTVVFGGPVYGPSLDKLSAAFMSDLPRPRVLLAAFVATWLASIWASRRRPADAGANPEAATGFQPWEITALLVLLVSPVVPYLYAAVAKGAFMTRYALFGVPAGAACMGALLRWIGAGRSAAGQTAAAVVLTGVVLYFPPKVAVPDAGNPVVKSVTQVGASLDPAVPLVLVNPIDVTEVDEQAPPELLRRMAFVADPDLALRYTGTNGIDLGYIRGEPYLRLDVQRLSYGELTSRYSRVYLVGKWQALSWLPECLKDAGWSVRAIGGTRQVPVFEARRPRLTP